MVVRSLALYLALTTLPAAAQNNFTIKLHGKPAGKASYSIEKTKDGYHVKSKVSYRLSAADNAPPDADAAPTKARSSAAPGRAADFQFVEDYKLDANSSYAGGFITDMVTLVNTSYNINKSRDQLFISQNQVGASGLSTPIAIKPNFVLLPDYDPSALQSLLLETVAHPAEKDLYLVLVPGKNPGEDAVPALWLTNQPDPHGTLDGKPVTLHHFILRLYKSQYDLVADETNTLMMTSSTNLSAIYTRDGSISWCTANNVGSDANNSSRLCFTFVRVATPIVPSTPLPTKFAAAEKHTFAVPPQARVLAIQPMIRDSNRQLPIMI